MGGRAKTVRMAVDIGMAALLPVLMAYSLVGETLHEVIGTAMMVLMVTHLVQNRRWVAAIAKGRYTPARAVRTALDLLLMAFMVLQPLSGILMSKHLYTFIRIPGISAAARQVHMVCAYWGFVLMSVHAGTHLLPMARKLRGKSAGVRASAAAAAAILCVLGARAFVKRQIPEYMFLRSMFVFFDYGESRARFFADYLAVMFLFAVLGLLLAALPGAGKRRRGKEK